MREYDMDIYMRKMLRRDEVTGTTVQSIFGIFTHGVINDILISFQLV